MTTWVHRLIGAVAAALIVGMNIGVAPAFAQVSVSGRGFGPGVEVPAGQVPVGARGETPLVLPRTGGPAEAQIPLFLVAGLGAALTGMRLQARAIRRGRDAARAAE